MTFGQVINYEHCVYDIGPMALLLLLKIFNVKRGRDETKRGLPTYT